MFDLLRYNKTSKIVLIDFETENLNLYLEKNLPWQVAMMRVKGDVAEEEYMRYIKWYRLPRVSPEAALITRFQPSMVADKGTDYKQVIKDVVDWTSDADYILGHNVLGFDIYFINAFYRMQGKSAQGIAEKMIDTHTLAKGIKLNKPFDSKKVSLLEYQYQMQHTIAKGVKTNTRTLGQEYGIEHDYENLHDALIDLRLNLKIWNHLKHLVEI